MYAASKDLGIYVSFPFCRAKCSFCNFASGVGNADAAAAYMTACLEEIGQARQRAEALGLELPEHVSSVYLGGGTPSLLTPSQMRALFAALRAEFLVASDAEITLEAAPGQIDGPVLEAAMACGVNRISLGVQSFVDREAQAVGRTHTGESCLQEIARLRAAGMRNLGVDLIAGLPHQTASGWKESLDRAAEALLEHLSVYMLEIDGESRLGREVLGGGARLHAPALPAEEAVIAMYEEACAVLPGMGLAQYEISNFAAPGRRSRHNERYWRRRPTLGFGLDAHSMLMDSQGRAFRWANVDELAIYTRRERLDTSAWVSDREAFEERVFLGLRLGEGLRWSDLTGGPPAWCETVRDAALEVAAAGLLEVDGTGCRLTGQGRLVAGEIFGELLCRVPV